jgi:acyl-coenzyme A thioesterase PaaI-like protein
MTTVHLVCDVLRAGRTLFVAETRLYADPDEVAFARSIVTFMNRRMVWDGSEPQRDWAGEITHIDDVLAPRFLGPGAVEIDVVPTLINGRGGTVQGGVLALLAELATESALAAQGRFAVADLDIRYLNRVKVGPVRAVAELTGEGASVRIIDAGDQHRLVAFVATTCSRL